jgi:hypothetical protein
VLSNPPEVRTEILVHDDNGNDDGNGDDGYEFMVVMMWRW